MNHTITQNKPIPRRIHLPTLRGNPFVITSTLETLVLERERNGNYNNAEARHLLNHYHEMTFSEVVAEAKRVTSGDILFTGEDEMVSI